MSAADPRQFAMHIRLEVIGAFAVAGEQDRGGGGAGRRGLSAIGRSGAEAAGACGARVAGAGPVLATHAGCFGFGCISGADAPSASGLGGNAGRKLS